MFKGGIIMHQLEFNLQDAIDNPENAKEIVRAINASFNELNESNKIALETAIEAKSVATKYHEQVQVLTRSNIDTVEAIKNIFMTLNDRKELWGNDPQMKKLMDGLATFVLSSGAIKMGVLREVLKDDK